MISLKQPICILTIDDKQLNEQIKKRIISVDLTDKRSNESDQLEITFDDRDGQLKLPKRGVKINCQLGFADEILIDKGDFIVDGSEWSGSPDTIKVKASSANFKSTAKVSKSRSFHQKKLGEIAQKIAQDNDLKLKISNELAALQIQHSDQTNESDLNYLKRLAKQNGAEMAIKKQSLLIFTAGTGKTATGQQLTTMYISKKDGDQYRYYEEDRESDYTGVSAYYRESGKKTRQRVTSGQVETKGGGDDPNTKTKVLRQTYASKQEAQRAADAAMQTKNRSMSKFEFVTAFGRPDIATEMPIVLQNFKDEINQKKWIVAEAKHSYSSAGLTTQIYLESS